MNSRQKKAKRQRANNHRKAAKTQAYKQRREQKWAERYRDNDMRRHWLDQPVDGMRWMTDAEVKQMKKWVLVGFFAVVLWACLLSYVVTTFGGAK